MTGAGSVMQAVLVGTADWALVDAETRLRAAQLAGDVAELDRLIADDLLFTGPDGQLATKEQDLAAHRSRLVRFHEHVPEELRIRPAGPTAAVAALRTRLAVEVAGTLHRGTFRYTRLWVRERLEWRIVAGHVSEVVVSSPQRS